MTISNKSISFFFFPLLFFSSFSFKCSAEWVWIKRADYKITCGKVRWAAFNFPLTLNNPSLTHVRNPNIPPICSSDALGHQIQVLCTNALFLMSMWFLLQCNYDRYYDWGPDMQTNATLPTWETTDICIIPGTYWKFQNFKQYDLAFYFLFQGSVPCCRSAAVNGIVKLRHTVQT